MADHWHDSDAAALIFVGLGTSRRNGFSRDGRYLLKFAWVPYPMTELFNQLVAVFRSQIQAVKLLELSNTFNRFT